MKEIKDYLHLYLGCDCVCPFGFGKLISVGNYNHVTVSVDGDRYFKHKDIKPILRRLSSMTEEDFYSFFKQETDSDILIKAKVSGYWCAGWYDKKEYQERIDEEMSVHPVDLITDLEEADHDNVYSWSKHQQIAYGTGDEMRFFLEPEEHAEWTKHLLSLGIDLFKLIDEGLAIDAATIKQTN